VSDFFAQLQATLKRSEQGLLKDLREKAWKQFSTLEMPEKGQEAFQYVPLRNFYSTEFLPLRKEPLSKEILVPHILPECIHSCIVFINGCFSEEYSSLSALHPSISVLSLESAQLRFRQYLQGRMEKTLKEEQDPFAALNGAMQDKGALLYIPPSMHVASPIQCLNVICTDQEVPFALFPRFQVVMGMHSEATLVFTIVSSTQTSTYWLNPFTDIALEEGAHLNYLGVHAAESKVWQFDALRATLKKNSLLKGTTFTQGAKTVRQDIRVFLQQEGAEVSLKGLSLLNGYNQSHTHILIDHQAPHCHSSQLFKSMLNDQSQASFEGKILVRQQAQKTQAYQLSSSLLLGEHAHTHSKPNLEIFADDVKASHGATVSQLDPNQLFYLRARGLTLKEAQRLLVLGFCQDVMQHFSLPSLFTRAAQALKEASL